MKKLLLGLLLLGSISAMADCTNAYKVKADKRSNFNHRFATIATMVLFPPSMLSNGDIYSENRFYDNKYYKSLSMIRAAKGNTLSRDFLEKLKKKVALEAYSDDVIIEIKENAIRLINELNTSKSICKIHRGKVSVLSFRKLSNLVIDKLNL